MEDKMTNQGFTKKFFRVAVIIALAIATLTPLTATTASADDGKPPIVPVQQNHTQPNVSWNCCNG
jgi:hypothetical protein